MVARAFAAHPPQAWELREEQAANDAAGLEDPLLDEKLDDASSSAESDSIALTTASNSARR